MKDISGIVLAGILISVLGLSNPITIYAQSQQEQEQELLQKAFQVMILANSLNNHEFERIAIDEVIKELELLAFIASEDVKYKVNNDWLPIIKKHGQAVRCLIDMYNGFIKRPGIVSQIEYNLEREKCYPSGLDLEVDRVIKEIDPDLIKKALERAEAISNALEEK